MFNETEVQLAQTVLNEIKNAAGSGFNYMVQGTIVSNELALIGLGVTILASLVVAAIAYMKDQRGDRAGSAFASRYAASSLSIYACCSLYSFSGIITYVDRDFGCI